MINNEIIPQIRFDLELISIENEGHQFILLSDKQQYTSSDIMISVELYDFLINIPFSTRYSDLASIFGIENNEILQLIIENIKFLDEAGFLESKKFYEKRNQIEKEYLELKERPYLFAGKSYPYEINELNDFMKKLFSSSDFEKYRSNAKALIIPHIDLKLIDESHFVYSSAYHSAYDTDFDLLVILGTAHYYSSDYFMLTYKNYTSPLGVSKTDIELLNLWNAESGNILHFNEFAHKIEHSIEFQILLSQYYFKDKNYTVLPILVGSFHDFILKNEFPENNEKFSTLINSLNIAIKKIGKKPLFISSVDFAHIGRKFDDNFDAESYLEQLKIDDKNLIDSIINYDKNKFFQYIIDTKDKNKICGTSPIYSMLALNGVYKGKLLNYSQWNDIATKSAVSFASIALY